MVIFNIDKSIYSYFPINWWMIWCIKCKTVVNFERTCQLVLSYQQIAFLFGKLLDNFSTIKPVVSWLPMEWLIKDLPNHEKKYSVCPHVVCAYLCTCLGPHSSKGLLGIITCLSSDKVLWSHCMVHSSRPRVLRSAGFWTESSSGKSSSLPHFTWEAWRPTCMMSQKQQSLPWPRERYLQTETPMFNATSGLGYT